VKVQEEYGPRYMALAKSERFCPAMFNNFFQRSKLVFECGLATRLLVRLGVSSYSEFFKVYLKKENVSCPPSILGILYSDIPEISAYMKAKLREIRAAVSEGKVLFGGPGPVQKSDNSDFWTHNDCYYAKSGAFRVRFQWANGNLYTATLNIPHMKVPSMRNFMGPNARWWLLKFNNCWISLITS
jgi:hypothetical protein